MIRNENDSITPEEPQYRGEFGIFQTPKVVTELFKLLADKQDVYVPFATTSQLIESLSRQSKVYVDKDGLRMTKTYLERISELGNVVAIDSSSTLSDLNVMIDPPFGMRAAESKYGLRDEGLIRFTDALPRLGDERLAVIASPLGITFKIPELQWLASLRGQGIYLQCIAQLPTGSYPNTSISVVVLIFSRKSNDKYLSLEVRDEKDESSFSRIKTWLFEPEKAKSDTNLISFIDHEALKTSDQIRRSNMLSKAFIKQGYPVVDILEGAEVNVVRHKETHTDKLNSIYLPNIGLSDVVTATSDMGMKNHSNYFQIALSDKFDAEYIARLLNTNIGKTLREDFMSGSFISKINLGTIKGNKFKLPVPTLVEQRKISALHHDIESSINQLRSIQADLDSHPKKLRDLRTSYGQMVQANDSAWIELLPSHLSVMLKKYYAAPEIEQYKRLLEFFEALNHLFAAIYLSYLKNSPNDKLWNAFKQDNEDLDLHRVFSKSTFGSWYKFMSTSANFIKSAKSEKSDNAYPNQLSIEQAMGITSPQLAIDVTNSMVSSVCKVAQEERNRDAHSFDSFQNTKQLQKLLIDIQPVLTSIFSHYKLICFKQAKPGEGELRPYAVNVLHGSSAVFDAADIELDRGINDSDIYLYEEDSERALKLQPVLMLMHSPSDVRNTVYYLNKSDGEDSVYRAYLDAGEAEVHITGSGIEY